MDITWAFEADFDRDGTYEEDLTPYVARPGNGVSISRGINPDGVYRVSSFGVSLRNEDGRFSDRNGSSPYFGRMNPDVPVRLRATHNAIDYTIWTGYIASWKRKWASGTVPMVDVECWDIAHYMVDSDPIHTTVGTTRDTDGALNAIFDAWEDGNGNDYIPAGDRVFDDGLQALPYHFAIGQKAMDAAMAVVRSEPGILWVNAQGQPRFEARDSRLGVSSPGDTWGDGTGVFPVAVEDLTNDYDYITSVRARASLFSAGQANVEVLRFTRGMDNDPADSIALAAGETYRRSFQISEALEAITDPVAATDYSGNAASDGSGADRTSSLSVSVTLRGAGYAEISITNTHATDTVYLTRFRLRAQPVNFFYGDHPEAFVELSVPGRPAGKGVEIDKPFAGDTDPYQLVNDAMSVLRTYRYAVPRITLAFVPNSDTARAKLLAVEMGDLIRYTDTALGADGSYTDDWFYVEALEYHIPPDWAGQSFPVNVTLTPSYVFRNLDAIAWDDFARADAIGGLGTSASGDAWGDDAGFDIVSGAARANSSATECALEIGADDQVVEVILNAIGADDEVGVCFRWTDANNQYRLYLDNATDRLVLEKNVAGTVSEIESVAVTVGTAHELRAMVQGSRIRAWLDHKLLIDVTDTALATGTKAGIFAHNAAGETTFHSFYGQGL
jgi:hypothetical protein